jgi:hypothetical protein
VGFKNLIEANLYINPTKNLIELKHYMNPTKNLIDPKLYMNPTKNKLCHDTSEIISIIAEKSTNI